MALISWLKKFFQKNKKKAKNLNYDTKEIVVIEQILVKNEKNTRNKSCSRMPPVINKTEEVYKELLTIFHGDKQKINRLIKYTQNKYPNFSTIEIYKQMKDDFIRDNTR